MNTRVFIGGRCLILGASGFIGSHLFRLARNSGVDVIGTTCRQEDRELVRFCLGADRVIDRVGQDFVGGVLAPVAVHCAGPPSVDACLVQREEIRRVHVDGTLQAMQDLQAVGVKQVFLSTSYVFDGARENYTEHDLCRPVNEYGRQKLEVEQWMQRNLDQPLILRLGKVVGESPGERHLFSQWWQNVRDRRPIYCTQDSALSPVSVQDVARAILVAVQQELAGVYHVAGATSCECARLAEMFLRAMSGSVPILPLPPAESRLADRRPLRTALDSSRFRKATGFDFTPLRDVLQTFAQSLRPEGSP
jgi:dTDP-4-dehydrorhamnose reductase